MQQDSSPGKKVATKRCGKCGACKPRSMFSVNRNNPDGLQGYCKGCAADYEAAARSRRNAQKRAWRASNRRRCRAAYRDYGRKYPERRAAHDAVKEAVKAGKLPRVSTCSCFVCGKQAEQYHHVDYSKRLEIIPVCRKCHREWHRYNRARSENDNITDADLKSAHAQFGPVDTFLP